MHQNAPDIADAVVVMGVSGSGKSTVATALAATRAQRSDLADLAHPQRGVDLIKDAFPGPTALVPGVRDVGDTAP